MRLSCRASLLAALALALPLLAACGGGFGGAASAGATSCPPDISAVDGKPLYGVDLDWARDTAAGYTKRLGRTPAVYVACAAFPVQGDDLAAVDREVNQVAAEHAALMLTLAPTPACSR